MADHEWKKRILYYAQSQNIDVTVEMFNGETYTGRVRLLADEDFAMDEASPSNGYFRVIQHASTARVSISAPSYVDLEGQFHLVALLRHSIASEVLGTRYSYAVTPPFFSFSKVGDEVVTADLNRQVWAAQDERYVPSIRLNSISSL